MKHQIIFLGGQLLPIYIGIKEFMPDKIHFIVSNESKEGEIVFKELFKELKFSEYVCDPFNFYSIRSILENIIIKVGEKDEIHINMTGGTKIMLLSAYSVIGDKKINGFYIDQDFNLIEIPTYSKKIIESQLSIRDFFFLSGHKMFSSKHLTDVTPLELKTSYEIESFAISYSKLYSRITGQIRKKHRILSESGFETLTDYESIKWGNDFVEIKNKNKFITFKSNNVKGLFFNAGWWELIVATEVAKWDKAKEVMIHCELPFKSDDKVLKNEIDILVNTGKKLIFVECKSGIIKQEDINKIKIVKQTYGGTISKSLLVSRFMPPQSIIEKCKELDIEIYYVYAFNRIANPINGIVKTLNRLEKKTSI